MNVKKIQHFQLAMCLALRADKPRDTESKSIKRDAFKPKISSSPQPHFDASLYMFSLHYGH